LGVLSYGDGGHTPTKRYPEKAKKRIGPLLQGLRLKLKSSNKSGNSRKMGIDFCVVGPAKLGPIRLVGAAAFSGNKHDTMVKDIY